MTATGSRSCTGSRPSAPKLGRLRVLAASQSFLAAGCEGESTKASCGGHLADAVPPAEMDTKRTVEVAEDRADVVGYATTEEGEVTYVCRLERPSDGGWALRDDSTLVKRELPGPGEQQPRFTTLPD